MYEANVDDVGYRLVAIYTPVRDDGVEGQPISASTDPIAVGKYILLLLIHFQHHLFTTMLYKNRHNRFFLDNIGILSKCLCSSLI